MKKKLFIIGLILVLLAGVAYARMTVVGIAGIVAAPAGGDPTTWGPTAIQAANDDAVSGAQPPDPNACLDSDGGSFGITGESTLPGGFRWETTIPEGATVNDIEFRFHVGFPPSPNQTARVYLHKVAAAGNFASGDMITARSKTTNYREQALVGGWNSFTHTDLVAAVQEVVDLDGFSGTLSFLVIPQTSDVNTQIHIMSSGSCGTNYATLEVEYE